MGVLVRTLWHKGLHESEYGMMMSSIPKLLSPEFNSRLRSDYGRAVSSRAINMRYDRLCKILTTILMPIEIIGKYHKSCKFVVTCTRKYTQWSHELKGKHFGGGSDACALYCTIKLL